jgi:iron complex outermembrane recepter protein
MRKEWILAVSLLAICAATPVSAQQAPTEPSADEGEIIVTAERREQSLQKLPTTASAVTGEALASQQIQRVDDLIKATPGLAVNDFGLGKAINIRGIGKGIEAPGVSAGVAYYVDGVAVPNSIFLETPFFDLARVEVLRGPQGTLVGMNSTGGAMLIVSNNPKGDAVEGMAELSCGNYSN